MTDKAISPLRQRLINDMAIRRLGPKTQHDYIRRVKSFADFVGHSPDKATAEDVHRYQLCKQDAVIAMLRQPEGATVDEVARVTGWQRHTVRGVFSGTLKKKLGLTLASAKEERGRVYRIAEPASV